MYLIVGLGNPENEYAHTRHNMGFDAINEIAKKNNINITKTKFKTNNASILMDYVTLLSTVGKFQKKKKERNRKLIQRNDG